MSEQVLTVVDTTGIQSYIFGSNRLRDNIGASHLVEQATHIWVYTTLKEIGLTNIKADLALDDEEPYDPQRTLEHNNLTAELLYAGGGNVVILFDSRELAQQWTRRYTRLLLRQAPGLAVVVVHSSPFVWNADGTDLAGRLDALIQNQLATAKQNRQPSAPLLGVGVTASCQSTSLIAVGTHHDNEEDASSERRVSSEVQAKVGKMTQKAADERFRRVFGAFVNKRRGLGLTLPHDFDNLGRTRGEQSYIAVVHADGNGMGKRFKTLAYQKLTNRAYIQAYRTLSQAVQKAGKAALNMALSPLIDGNGNLIAPYDKNAFLPFRPLVYGGDDVTFVCDGRLGLLLTTRYLTAFEQQMKEYTGDRSTACAGIAIVKAHYPFARAYSLSEALCKNAKRWVCQQDEQDGNLSALDWHIASSGILGHLKDIRERNYDVGAGSLTMRPIRLHTSRNEWRTWPDFATVVNAFHTNPEWGGKRNKIKRLREVLRRGPQATEQFLKLYGLAEQQLPTYVQAPSDLQKQGWSEQVCGYFDPIEAMDFFDVTHLEYFYDPLFSEDTPAQ